MKYSSSPGAEDSAVWENLLLSASVLPHTQDGSQLCSNPLSLGLSLLGQLFPAPNPAAATETPVCPSRVVVLAAGVGRGEGTA